MAQPHSSRTTLRYSGTRLGSSQVLARGLRSSATAVRPRMCPPLQMHTAKPSLLSPVHTRMVSTRPAATRHPVESSEEEESSYEEESSEEVSESASSDYESSDEDTQRPVSPCEEVDSNLPRRTLVLQPLFQGRPPTLFFDYPPQCFLPSKCTARTLQLATEEDCHRPLFYRYSKKAHVYNCVVTALQFNGFSETHGGDFNVYISGAIRPKLLLEMDQYQKYNHYPGSWQLGRKDNLWRNVSRMRRAFGEEFAFCPPTYLLPEDFPRFRREKEEHPQQLWILKPKASACGRGIRVLSNKSRIKKKKGYLISQYISSPHLLKGLKYDLRLYVCVTSYDPLRIYLYKEGLVRFATQPYTTSKSSVTQRYIHLTNYAVNRLARNYQSNSDCLIDDQGSKWSHTALKRTFAALNIDPEAVFARVKDVIVKTIIAAEPLMVNSVLQYARHRGNCYETYGFDILLDATLRPWLMEVNVSPSLNNGSPLDKKVKTALMADIFTLIGLVQYDREECKQQWEQKRMQRMLGLTRGLRKRPSILSVKGCKSLSELDLTPTDLEILMETEEEAARLGNFERLFPTKAAIPKYSRYLQPERVSNLLTWKMVMDETDFLSPLRIG